MTCDVIIVVAILEIVLIYMDVYFLCNTNVLDHEINIQKSSFSVEYIR